MATTNAPQLTAQEQQAERLPPEEKFWQRYSPHQEMPLSAITSFGLHFVTIGALIVLAWLGWLGFRNSGGSVPVEPVRVAGGGGDPRGEGAGRGTGGASQAIQDKSTDPTESQQPPAELDPTRPKLDAPTPAKLPETLPKDADFPRFVQNGNPKSGIFKEIEGKTQDKLREGLPQGQGKGGTGEGGGKGDGSGPGEGNGAGPGKSRDLSPREIRRNRWHLVVPFTSGEELLEKWKGLGAILAVTDPATKKRMVIRDLSGRGAPALLDEDPFNFNLMYWFYDNDEGRLPILALTQALHLNFTPSEIWFFLPVKTEERMRMLEKQAAGGIPEDQILSTKFTAIRTAKGIDMKVELQTAKSQRGNRPSGR